MGLFDRFKHDKKTPISAAERKKQNEAILRENNIPFIDHLPFIEEEAETSVRNTHDIAERILILTYLAYVSEVPDAKPDVIAFLRSETIWDNVSPRERILFQEEMTQQDKIDVSWRSEAIWLLLWCIKKVEKLELPYKQINIPEIVKLLPAFKTSTKEFIESATIRSTSEILDIADLTYRLHWATRQFQLTGTSVTNINPGVVYERHYAINWVTCYADEWDEITTDT